MEINLLLFLAIIWTLPWKGWALWLAAKRDEKIWFIAILFLNTMALLEIFYILFIVKKIHSKK